MNAADIKIILKGRCKVGSNWVVNATNGLNRLYYINGGTGGYIKKGERIPFKAGNVYLIPYYANISTYTSLTDNLDHTYVGFLSNRPIFSADVLAIDTDSDEKLNAVINVFRKLAETGYVSRRAPTPYPYEEDLSLLRATITFFVDKMLKANTDRIIEDRTIVSALNIMSEKIGTRITVADIAQMHGFTPTGFIKRFKQCVGETPYSYFKKLKVRTALAMREMGATLEEAADACGYSDASALLHAINSDPT